MCNSLTDEIKAKLTSEQLIIAERWEVERHQREILISKLENNEMSIQDVLHEMNKITPSHCEHGRAVVSNCIACDEIERIIRPEAFNEEDHLED